MRTEIVLQEEDYLAFQLFAASKSKSIRNKRRRSWILTSATCLLLGAALYQPEKPFLTYYFLSIGVVCLLFYPFYTRWRYKKHYLNHIREHYRQRFGLVSQMELEEGYLLISDSTGEAKIKLSEIEEINETKDHAFLKLRTGVSLIIPKQSSQGTTFLKELDLITKQFPIKRNVELDWKWK